VIQQGHLATRAIALDALRGFAILAMVLVAVQPDGVLPAWMYHAQQPPPTHDVVAELNGLTWPDVVFPCFLFSLGAAIPLALGRRLAAGEPKVRIVRATLLRGALLLFLALFRQHFDAASVSPLEPLWLRYVLALLGFLALFGILMRLPAQWSARARAAVRISSWILAVTMLLLVRFPDGTGASLARIDYILQALAHVAVLGSFIWLVTRGRVVLRLGILAAVVAFRFAAWRYDWASSLWGLGSGESPVEVGFVVFLCAVIPGTIVGDLIAARLRSPSPSTNTRSESWSFIRTLIVWGACWSLLGVLLAFGYEGINKIQATLSWLFTCTGISILGLAGLVIVTDVLGKGGMLRVFVENGQNPVLAYVANGMFLKPTLALTGLEDRIGALTTVPTLAFLRAVFLTVLIAYLVSFFTRKGVLWRT
jgi:predicted acyltransferase